MKKTHWRGGVKGRALTGHLWILVAVAGAGTSIAHAQQSATVTGHVETPHGETAKETLKVLAVSKPDRKQRGTTKLTDQDFNYTAHFYTYRIDRLQPGKYDFVACDGLDYQPEVKTATVEPGQNITVDFFLRDQPRGSFRIVYDLQAEGRPEAGVPLYLKDRQTGCIVAQTATDRNGHFEFLDVQNGKRYELSRYEPNP